MTRYQHCIAQKKGLSIRGIDIVLIHGYIISTSFELFARGTIELLRCHRSPSGQHKKDGLSGRLAESGHDTVEAGVFCVVADESPWGDHHESNR